MCKRYKKDAAGRPIGPEGKAAYEYNYNMIKAFSDHDYEKVKPYLQDMLRDVLNCKLSIGMTNFHYLQDHPEDLAEIRKVIYIQEWMNKEWTKPFFDNLPENVKMLLQAKMGFRSMITNLISYQGIARGVKLAGAAEIKRLTNENNSSELEDYNDAVGMYQGERKKFTAAVKKYWVYKIRRKN